MRPPPKDIVQRIGEEVAEAHGLKPITLFCGRGPRKAVEARVQAWRKIIHLTGCSRNGLAEVWGCDRKTVERALQRAGVQ